MTSSPATMRAVRLSAPGAVDNLQLTTLPFPPERDGWVRIRVEAFGLNRSELKLRLGLSVGVSLAGFILAKLTADIVYYILSDRQLACDLMVFASLDGVASGPAGAQQVGEPQVIQRGPMLKRDRPGAAVLPHTGPVKPAVHSAAEQIQPPAGRRRRARRPRLAGPSDQVLHRLAGWYAIALRLGSAVLFTAVAVLAARKQISGWLLGAPLTALCLWSAFFTWRIRRSGLTTGVVLADAAVISALVLAQQHLVQAVLIKDGTTWMLPLACTSVYILQIALRPWLGLAAAAIVIIAYGLGAGHPADAWLLVVETIVAAGLVALIRGGARQADAIVAAGLEAERQIRAEEARHADEREQHRQLHDTVLSTLTMVTAGAFAGPSAALTAQAARDLRMLQGLAGAPAVPGGLAPLTDLRPKLEWAAACTDDLAVRLKLSAVTLPSPVADQIAACVGEALRNVERHAGTGQAEVTVTGGAGWAVVKIIDRGRGFDPAATAASRRGIRESITGRMLAAGGRAAIASRPGAGTTVTLSWPA